MRGNIALFGFMGTGKSAAGRLLAERLGFTLVDTDARIVEREGRPIPAIFASEGESYFRRVEREVVRSLAELDGCVIATGGGVVLNPDNIRDLRRHSLLVCLTARPEIIHARTSAESHRPLIESDDKFQRIVSILANRAACYASIPNQIDTSDLSVEAVADRVEALYRQWRGAGSGA